MKKYIFICNNIGNYCSPSGYTIDQDGKLENIGFVVDGVKIPETVGTEIIKSNTNLFLILTQSEFNKITQNQKINTMFDKNGTIIPVENVRGGLDLGRVEDDNGGGAENMTIFLTLDYTDPTAPGTNLSTLLGDGFDMMKNVDRTLDNLAAAVANGLLISGTYGDETINVLNKMSIDQVRLHVMQGESSAASYWSNKTPAYILKSNGQGSAQKVAMNFQLNQDGSQFNDKIRQVPNFRCTLSTRVAIQLFVNNGEYVSYNFQFRSAGRAKIMQLED